MTHPVIEGMRERGFGRIVSFSSINGQKGQIGQTNYAASKVDDLGFAKSLAQENAGKGITLNAVCPGYIATNMVKAVPKEVLKISVLPLIPVGQLGEPEEIARCTLIRDARGVFFMWNIGSSRDWGTVGREVDLKAHTQICTDPMLHAKCCGSFWELRRHRRRDNRRDELRGFGTPPAAKKSWSYSGTRRS
jgi:hypothetical protein